jgi:hypothetical protein
MFFLGLSVVTTVLIAWGVLLLFVGAWLLVAGELRHRRRARRGGPEAPKLPGRPLGERRRGIDQRQGAPDRRAAAAAPPDGVDRRSGPSDRRTGRERRRFAPRGVVIPH